MIIRMEETLRELVKVLLVITYVCISIGVSGQFLSPTCGDGRTLGTLTNLDTTPADDPLGRTFLAYNTYTFDCYGVIKMFEFYCHKNGDVSYRVFRPEVGTSNYKLIAEWNTQVSGCVEKGYILLYDSRSSGAVPYKYETDSYNLATEIPNDVLGFEIVGSETWTMTRDNGETITKTGPLVVTNNDGFKPSSPGPMESVKKELPLPQKLVHYGLQIQPGDILGISQENGGVVLHDTPMYSSERLRYTDEYTIEGGTLSIPIKADNPKREYKMRVTLGPPPSPRFINLPRDMQIREDISVGSLVYQVSVDDRDMDFGPFTYSIAGDPYFDIDTLTGSITCKASFNIDASLGLTYSVTVRDVFNRVITDFLYISVVNLEEQHTVDNLPDKADVDIKTVVCEDSGLSPDVLFTVIANAPDPRNLEFKALSLVPSDGMFKLIQQPGIDPYTANVVCTDQSVLVDKLISPYTMKISVVDTDTTYTVGPLALTINLLNMNQPPVFTNLPRSISVPETLTGGNIFTLSANDNDNDVLQFTLTAVTPAAEALLFNLNTATGDLSVTPNPGFDYELGTRTYKLSFTVEDHLHLTGPLDLTINIEDKNEAPICDPADYHITIPEKLGQGTTLQPSLTATDEDGDTVTFYLSQGANNPYFTVRNNQLEITSPINLGESPDQVFSLIVTGYDNNPSPLSCTAEVNVTVQQVNDPHAISNLPGSVTVDSQTALEGDWVFNVTAFPEEPMDKFTYSWSSPTPADGSFRLDPITGEVTVAKNLSLITYSEYNFYISVTDHEGNTAGPKRLVIYCDNIKRPPIIKNLPQTVSVPETTTIKTLLQIDASDPDNDEIIRYNIVSVTPISGVSKFVINDTEGTLSTANNPEFDYETQSTYVITCTVEDFLYESEPKQLTVTIYDVNEPPEIITQNYTAEVFEEADVGTTIPLFPNEIDAFDPDIGDTLTFQAYGSPYSDLFTFAMGSGSLQVARRIDREAGVPGEIYLQVLVTDSAGAQGPTMYITLTVVDINDHIPKFASDSYSGKISEDTYGGTSILTVVASDGDATAPNKQFYYTVNYANSEASTYFMADPDDGEIRVRHQIDYNRFPLAEFEVLAIDNGWQPGPLTGTTTVTIQVGDVNDGRPYFMQDFVSLEVASNEDIGYHIVNMLAIDEDSYATSNVSYYYMKYSPQFYLDGQTGDISIRRNLEDNKKYVLYLTARDNGVPNEEISNIAIVRIDTFNPRDYLIDMELSIPLKEYDQVEAEFITELAEVMKPWTPKIHQVHGQQDFRGKRRLLATSDDTKTVVTLYALENLDTYDITHLTESKDFVSRNDLLAKLREDLDGTPSKELRSPAFGDFMVSHVSPTYPIWIIDTVEGVATLSMICLAVTAALIVLTVCCCRRNPTCGSTSCDRFLKSICKKDSRPVTPEKIPSRPPTTESAFRLNYKKPEEYGNNLFRRNSSIDDSTPQTQQSSRQLNAEVDSIVGESTSGNLQSSAHRRGVRPPKMTSH